MGDKKVVIAHDYLTQRGGAERVVLAMLRAFPDATLLTSVYNEESTFQEFRDFDVRSTWLSRVDSFRDDPRRAFPFLARAWSRTNVDADVVLCSSSGWAHGVNTNAPKIVYCHNPARWLYQTDEYLQGNGRGARVAVQSMGRRLRAWDRRAALSASRYIANSTIVANRVADTYGIESTIVHPPSVVSAGPLEPVPGIEPGYFLTVGRARGYKNTDVVAQAVESMPGERLVAVGGRPAGTASERIVGLDYVTDAQLRWLYANAAALVACAYEDFGLTPIEAFNAGTPVVALRAGGYLDTMIPGVTGEFVTSPTPEHIAGGLRRLRQQRYSTAEIRAHGERFGVDRFTDRMREIVLDDRLIGELVA